MAAHSRSIPRDNQGPNEECFIEICLDSSIGSPVKDETQIVKFVSPADKDKLAQSNFKKPVVDPEDVRLLVKSAKKSKN